ncbi:MAG: DUF5985 family protein [Pseudomonadota bacterium]|nr:DUF5985 family protein [Pseudomonadota bacterium]
MNDLLLGATAMGSACIALFFLRFWRESRDVFHLLFAASFVLLAIQRIMLATFEEPNEGFPALYLPRLAAYLLIIIAVAQKNSRKPVA